MIYHQVKFALAAALALMGCPVAAEDQAAHDKSEVEAIIQSIYAKKIGELEYPSGKDATPFRKRCHFLQSMFEGGCRDASGYYPFVEPPQSEADLADLPSACKSLELSKIRPNPQ